MEDQSKAGISSLLSSMLNESTVGYTAESMTEALGKLGSEISVYSDRENIYYSVSGLKKNLDATLKLLEERMFRPKFDADEFATAKTQQLAGIANRATRATAIAEIVYAKLLYGKHNMGIPQSGYTQTVEAITLEDLKTYFATYIQPGKAKLVYVGSIKQSEFVQKIGFMKAWTDKIAYPSQPLVDLPKIDKTRIYFVNKDKAPQSEIRIGYLALPFDADGEFYRANIMNYVMGGNFNSRINLMLREKKGYTYGARTSFSGNFMQGPFTASAGVKAEKTDSSLMDFFSEMRIFRDNGITADELAFTKSSLGQRDALKYETPFQKASFLERILVYNLSNDFTQRQSNILQNMTADQINLLAKKHLPIEKMVVVVVGDKATNLDKVKALGYEVVELDAEGNTVN
jgi:zinc protease